MADGTVLRPVTLSPEAAALVWRALQAVNVPGAQVRLAAQIIEEIELATVPLPTAEAVAAVNKPPRKRR